jgi:GT2 family glycosyltransferase
MARAGTRASETVTSATPLQPPSVLVILVAKDGARWLRQCLRALSRQTHPRLGVLAVDNASTDGSGHLLEQALGPSRVIGLQENVGFAGAVNSALGTEVAGQADYLLLLHDDTVLAPDAVTRMVQAAERVEGAGIVGPKVLDWDHPRQLRSIGMFTDRFGYPYSPLEEDEIDQGQYDRIREVLFVSSCAMLVAGPVQRHIGPPDERYGTRDEDLDFCWRARLAGFRVVVTPFAEARHRGATSTAERPDAVPLAHYRYQRERSALANMLKNYGWFSLLWLLPLYFALGATRVLFYVGTRRFEDALQVLGAWSWNVANLGGTVRRRARAQSARAVPDREIRRFMAPPGDRARRLAASLRRALFPGRGTAAPDEEGEERPTPPFRTNLWRFALAHPVATAWVLSAVVVAIGYRNILGAPQLAGGALAAVPSAPGQFFRELMSGVRHTGLGGTAQASPALGMLGVGSLIALGRPLLLQKVLLIGLPAFGGVTCYRMVRGLTRAKVPAVLAAAAYAFSPIVLWSISEGRIPELVFLAAAPWLAAKLFDGLQEDGPPRPRRWLAGCALGVGGLLAFFPGGLLGAGLLLACTLVIPPSPLARRRRLPLLIAGFAGAAVLAFPVGLAVLASHGAGLADPVGSPSFAALVRLVVSRGPGGWVVAFCLPVAAALGLLFVSGPAIRAAAWAAALAVSSLCLAWLAGADRLPEALSNPVVFTSLTAFAYAVLVGLGLVSVIEGVASHAFGYRQLGGAFMAMVLTVGLVGQISEVGRGGWEIGPASDVLPEALPVVGSDGSYRVLWIGDWSGGALLAPGGTPDGRVEAGRASIRYSVTLPAGASVADFGRPAAGLGYDRLETALLDVLAGGTRHGGALLSPFAIRFVVAAPRDVPHATIRRLSDQLDMDVVPAGGLVVYRVPGAVPLSPVTTGPEWLAAARASTFAAVASLPAPSAGAAGQTQPAGLVLLSQQFDSHWRLSQSAGPATPFRAFGWAVGFEARAPSPSIRYEGQAVRDGEVGLLVLLWLGALWISRRPATRG